MEDNRLSERSINLNEDTKLVVYPNPASNSLYFAYSDNSITEFKIFDMNGSIIKEGFTYNNQSVSIDLESGLYLFQLKDEHGHTKSTKFILQSKDECVYLKKRLVLSFLQVYF